MSRFFDTNILVYAFLDAVKRERAIEVLSEGGLISIQVLNEFTNVALKKRRRSWPEIEAALGVIRARFPKVILLTVEIHASAVVLAREHGLSIYDALIVAAALRPAATPSSARTCSTSAPSGACGSSTRFWKTPANTNGWLT